MHVMTQDTRSPRRERPLTARARLRLLVLVAGAAVGLGPSGARSAEPAILARVNGEPVTQGELRLALADPSLRRRLQQDLGVREPDSQALERLALQKLINRRLILQEAGRRNFAVTEQELSRAATAFRRRFKDARRYVAWMKTRELDEKSLREGIRAQILTTRVMAALAEEVRVTDEQVQEYYEAHQDDLKTVEEVRLRRIAVTDKAAADEIVGALGKGEDFDHLARERSVGFDTGPGGGAGWVSVQTLAPPLRRAVGTLKAGETGGPLEQDGEFLVFRLEERRPAQTRSVAEARPEIERRLLTAKRQEIFQAWLTEQEQKAKIEVFLQPERGREVSGSND